LVKPLLFLVELQNIIVPVALRFRVQVMKYLSVMLSLIFKHQRYLIEGVEKISER